MAQVNQNVLEKKGNLHDCIDAQIIGSQFLDQRLEFKKRVAWHCFSACALIGCKAKQSILIMEQVVLSSFSMER